MKTNLLPSIILTTALLVLLCGAYPLLMWGIAKVSPNSGEGFTVESTNGKNYVNIGQTFTSDKYFWSRPSAVEYNAAGSGASNKAATNAEYLAEVEKRIEDFMTKNPEVKKEDIPVDLITASGSGLDPNISVQAAKIQIARIAKSRGIEVSRLEQLVAEQTQQPLLGILGPQKINVLELNIALDALK
ncbi:MAG: potassium-transporting ATPase subunit KdpC [Flavobacterium sp.]|uniref:potassium-transporting ATPase subunit KdpC n=1 Tax=Myroides marinus TaxID=703342 RepID=UPI002577EDC8|nr:potassium-transporting ATPase subunit KdpC [Myroides marinus]MDM1380270.1 potassium-transporting ATPase subunit KdpC [Myroides marinus]MDM1387515.1 potassium-transporting ATPase subunit KdpC [Myroides marinus]MDM1394727.1 potassium-transporting ATPase subunit KdpC [Myroides marinus]MDM1501044.1 potassium-transporting ATPase subunit KdpC [Myroides marinus]